MKYSITRSVSGCAAEITISKSAFNKLKKARKALSAGLAIEEKYEVLLVNYEDFEKEIVNASIESMLNRPRKYDDFRCYIARFNKRLINLLTASRLYVDHIKQHVRDIVPNPSEGKDKVQGYCDERCNKYKEYRFMEALRNYVQHCGFPVHYITLPSRVTDINGPERRLIYTIDLFSEKKRLQEDRKFKKGVLEKLDERIDLKYAARQYVECLSEIQTCVREIVSKKLDGARSLLESYINSFEEKFDEKTIGLAAIAFDDKKKIDEVPLLLDWDDIRIDLTDKNRVLTNLSSRYVTSETKKA